MSEHSAERALPPATRERTDVSFGAMVALFALILALLLLMLGVAYWTYPDEIHDRRFALPVPGFPAPVLQPSPRVDMSTFYAEEMQRLNGYGWQDKAAGLVHIPIGQAMGLVAREGVPGWPTSAAASQGDRR